MRIIGGKNKGRKIVTPNNLPVRPTTDLGKESLFNILNNYFYFDNIFVLDLFAGTGNISYEFASRGALNVIAIDNNQHCTDFIKKTAQMLNYNNIMVIKSDAFQFIGRCRQKFDIIFADPPYDFADIEKIVDDVFANNLLNPSGWLIVEHAKTCDFSKHPYFYQHRKYGKLNFSFLVQYEEKIESETK